MRPSRQYKNGVGKPVVAKRFDEVSNAYRWRVVFPQVNNYGAWIVAPEAKLCQQAEYWCMAMNDKLRNAEIAAYLNTKKQ